MLRARLDELFVGHDEAQHVLSAQFVARTAAVTEEKPSDTIGRYKLLQKIGEGGCGVVSA